MRDFIAHDVRLVGSTPHGQNIDAIQVGAATPLTSFVTQALNAAEANKGEICLKIMAHGAGDEKKEGGVILFCKENLRLSTVEQMRPLAGKIKGGIELLVCRAAMITPGKERKDGDGNMFCSRMAQITGTTVTASTAIQLYTFGRDTRGSCDGKPGLPHPSSPIDFGAWEGTVLIYKPDGSVGSVNHYPTGYEVGELPKSDDT